MSKHQPSELLTHLTTFRRRLRLRDGWLLGQRTFWVAVAGVIGILVLGRLVPIHQLGIWAWVWPFTIWLCAVAGFSILHPKPLTQIAQRVDLELGLKERISTALELESQGTAQFTTPQVTQSPNLPIYQQNDALATARTIEPRKAFPLTWLRRPLALAAILLALTIVLTFLPNPMDAVIAERAAIEQAAQEQAEKIEEIKKEIAESQELSPEIQAELLRQLEELAQQLRENPGDREKALADLSKLEENLRRQLDPNADQRQATLEAINAQLQALAQREDIDQSSLDLTAEALEKLAQDLANMDEAERDALAQALAEMAVLAAQSGDSALAQALASMSQAAQSGNAAAASQSSSDAAEALAQAQQQLTDQDSLQQTLAQLQNASQTMAQAGQPSGQQVAGQNPGQGQQPGQGQAAGQNPGQGQSGQGQSGGGTKADTLPPGSGSGQARRPNQGDNTSGASGELGEQVFIPWERRPENGAEVSIPGKDTGQGETITRENPNPSGGLPGPAMIPYQQVFTQYQQAAQQLMERSDIPPAYRDLVRDYFTQLEP